MRIAIFTETFLPKVDGIVNTLCHLLDHLARHDHQSILFAPEGGPEKVARTPVIGLKGYDFPLYPELKLASPFTDFQHHLEEFRPHVVHVVNPVSLGLAGMRAARRLNLPVVASYHTDVPGYAKHWGLGTLHQPLWATFRWIHNQADLNLCPSQWTLNELEAQKFQHLKVWTRGVDTVQFHPGHRTKHWREWLSKGHPYSPLLLYVGRLSKEKRVDWLLPVLQSTPNARLAIVGDGPEREHLEALFAGQSVVFTGYLHGHELAQAYAAADVFVFPSANETLGNVVLEAMASGLPVITARSGGPLDIVDEEETGLMFAPDSQDELITAVHRLVHNPDLARRIGRAARAYAASRSWQQVLDKLLDDYQWLIQQHQTAGVQLPAQAGWLPNLFS